MTRVFRIITLILLLTLPCGAFSQSKTIGRINSLRQKYLTTHQAWLRGILADSELYRLYVRKALRERNMPSFLEYLPIVESNYNPRAKSHVGALGAWQFMLNSVKPFLVCNEYVDERLDVFKSTDAALSKLMDNYKMFGDWFLAISAYNCGAGALRRAIKKAGTSDFWKLCDSGYLKEQTQFYVPKLLAISDVVENADLYGIDFPQVNEDIDTDLFEYVTVNKEVSLAVLASSMRIDEGELLELNRALVRGVTPPNQSYPIRVLAGQKESVIMALYDMKYFN